MAAKPLGVNTLAFGFAALSTTIAWDEIRRFCFNCMNTMSFNMFPFMKTKMFLNPSPHKHHSLVEYLRIWRSILRTRLALATGSRESRRFFRAVSCITLVSLVILLYFLSLFLNGGATGIRIPKNCLQGNYVTITSWPHIKGVYTAISAPRRSLFYDRLSKDHL